MTGVAAASSALDNCGPGELRRATPTTGTGFDTDAGLRDGEGEGVSLSSSGRDVPWMATEAGGRAGASAALMKSSEVAFSGAGAEAISSGWAAPVVESVAWRVW